MRSTSTICRSSVGFPASAPHTKRSAPYSTVPTVTHDSWSTATRHSAMGTIETALAAPFLRIAPRSTSSTLPPTHNVNRSAIETLVPVLPARRRLTCSNLVRQAPLPPPLRGLNPSDHARRHVRCPPAFLSIRTDSERCPYSPPNRRVLATQTSGSMDLARSPSLPPL